MSKLTSAVVSSAQAYVYYVVPPGLYQDATSYIRSSALVASILAGLLGDLLTIRYNVRHSIELNESFMT